MSLSSNKMQIVPLLLLIAPAALAAPMSAEDSGEEVEPLGGFCALFFFLSGFRQPDTEQGWRVWGLWRRL